MARVRDIFDADTSSDSDGSLDGDLPSRSLRRSPDHAKSNAKSNDFELSKAQPPSDHISRDTPEKAAETPYIPASSPVIGEVPESVERVPQNGDILITVSPQRKRHQGSDADSDVCILGEVVKKPKSQEYREVVNLVSSSDEEDDESRPSSSDMPLGRPRYGIQNADPKSVPEREPTFESNDDSQLNEIKDTEEAEPDDAKSTGPVQVTLHCIIPNQKSKNTFLMNPAESFRKKFKEFPSGTVFYGQGVKIASFATPSLITDNSDLEILIMTRDQYANGDYFEFLSKGDQEDEEASLNGSQPTVTSDSEKNLFISINCPDGSRFSVRADTGKVVGKLIDFIRSQKGLASNHKVTLTFDGDRLDPTSLISETEIEDEDVLDARF